MKTETVGDVFDRRGPCELMALVVQLAEKHGKIPVGTWTIQLDPDWELRVNGTADKWDGVPPWHGMMTSAHNGWPVVVLFNTVDGQFIGPPDTENRAVAVLKRSVDEPLSPAMR
jgi:hypothetical protein